MGRFRQHFLWSDAHGFPGNIFGKGCKLPACVCDSGKRQHTLHIQHQGEGHSRFFRLGNSIGHQTTAHNHSFLSLKTRADELSKNLLVNASLNPGKKKTPKPAILHVQNPSAPHGINHSGALMGRREPVTSTEDLAKALSEEFGILGLRGLGFAGLGVCRV